MVPYGKSRDYFYSGHTGYMVFGILYFSKVGSKPLTVFNIIGLIVIMFVVLVTRVHYTIDIFTGYVISHEAYWFVNKYLPIFDWIWSIPYHLTLKLYNKITTT
jgi:hypothetical protein